MAVLPIFAALTLAACEANLKPVTAALQRNDLTAATELLQVVPPECKNSGEFFTLKGATEELSGKSSEAEASFQQAIAREPKAARLRLQLGATYLRNGKPAEAAKVLREAVALEPGNPAPKKYLVGAYIQLGAWDRAAALFAEPGMKISAVADPTLILWFAQAMIKTKQPGRLDTSLLPGELPAAVAFSLGTLCAQNGLYDRAIAYLKSIPTSDADEAVYFNLGLSYSHLQSFDEARRNYFYAIDKSPGYVEAYFRVGLDYAAAGEVKTAVPWLFRAYSWSRDRSDIVYALVEQLIGLSYFETASDILKHAESAHPADGMLLVALGDLNLAKGMLDAAVANYQDALRGRPDLAPALVGRSRAEVAKGDVAGARIDLHTALRSAPADSAALGDLGLLEAQQHKWQSAEGYLRQAWSQVHSNPAIALGLSRVYRHVGNAAAALDVLGSVAALMQESIEFHTEQAQVYDQLHRSNEAEVERRLISKLRVQAENGLSFDTPRTYVY